MSAGPTLQEAADLFAVRARAAGHPVLGVAPGRVEPSDRYPRWIPPSPDGQLAPNDLLEAARETAYARISWIHAVLPTTNDAARLAAAIHPHLTGSTPSRTTAGVPHPRTAHPVTDTRPAWLRLLHRPTHTPGHGSDPRAVPFDVLVAQTRLTVRTLTLHRDGQTAHITEIPAVWLTNPLTEVTR